MIKKNPTDGKYNQCSDIKAFKGYRLDTGSRAAKNQIIAKNIY